MTAATLDITGASVPAQAPPRLPPLREELQLHPAAARADGQPRWTLHDPVRNQFFQIDWPTAELLGRWSLGHAADVLAALHAETTLALTEADVLQLLDFLRRNELVAPAAGQSRAFAARLQQRHGGGLWTWLLHHYLFFRVPLLRPDRLLGWLAPRTDWLFSRGFAWVTLLAGLLGMTGVLRESSAYGAALVDLFTWQGLAAYGLTLAAVKTAHEFAHGLVAKRLGCRVPTMGVAMMVLWPVAYTDTTEAWKLPEPTQRMRVAAAGIATELVIAVWATLAWLWLPEGALKTAAFLLSSTTWLSTLAVNASPFMRFDGYFILSDALDMPNLHARAFALARWHLREVLFGLGEPAPETLPARRRQGLILFAWATWIYRLVLFLGIAVLVYHFFIKAVGLLLFAVELGWFIASPLWGELKVWWAQRARIGQRRRGLLALGAVGVLALGVVPLPARITGMGLLQPAEQVTLYAPAGAQVTALPFRHGDTVQAGDMLFDVRSDELRLRSAQASARMAGLQGQVTASAFDVQQRRDWQVAMGQLQTRQAEAQTVSADARRYAPLAPFAGRLVDVDPDLHAGDWVAQNEVLGRLVATGPRQVVTYVDERAVRGLRPGDRGLFIVDALKGPVLALHVRSIERDAARTLNERVLASSRGGNVPVREQGQQLRPEGAVFRVVLEATQDDTERDDAATRHAWRGLVVLSGEPEALLAQFWRHGVSVFWREAGF